MLLQRTSANTKHSTWNAQGIKASQFSRLITAAMTVTSAVTIHGIRTQTRVLWIRLWMLYGQIVRRSVLVMWGRLSMSLAIRVAIFSNIWKFPISVLVSITRRFDS